MSDKKRNTEEIQAKLAELQAAGEAIAAKVDSGEATPEEVEQLAEVNKQIEALQGELAGANEAQRFAAAKERMNAPKTPAPKLPATIKREETGPDAAECLRLWFASQFAQSRLTHDQMYRMAQLGFHPGSKRVQLPVNFANVNHKRRTKLSTGGSTSGAELTYKTYSDKVTEFISYESPFVGALASESLSNGSERTYYKLDATALKSAKTSASGGSETSPTIPEVNASTAKVVIKPITFTSGYQKITWEMTQDSGVDLLGRMSSWNGASHARAIEDEVLNGVGTGSDDSVEGLLHVANAVTPVSSFDADAVEGLYYKIPQQYRKSAIFLVNDATAALLRSTLKDGVERSLFDKNIVDGVEWDTFLGKRFYVSEYMEDEQILYFVPDHYQLLFGGGEEFATFDEKFFPDKAVAGLIRFSGAWLGPTGANGTVHMLALDS